MSLTRKNPTLLLLLEIPDCNCDERFHGVTLSLGAVIKLQFKHWTVMQRPGLLSLSQEVSPNLPSLNMKPQCSSLMYPWPSAQFGAEIVSLDRTQIHLWPTFFIPTRNFFSVSAPVTYRKSYFRLDRGWLNIIYFLIKLKTGYPANIDYFFNDLLQKQK